MMFHYSVDGPKTSNAVTLGNDAAVHSPSYTQVLLRSTFTGRGPAS